jgi:hypothetical protein
MPANATEIEKRLWEAAGDLRVAARFVVVPLSLVRVVEL